ncbi:hypothetical protein HDU89_006098 [Geranomyces variabilis]|nr:hypothetical protein HDU89_006098 [Geranomyces variabilis]
MVAETRACAFRFPKLWNEATTPFMTKWAATVTRAHIAPNRYRAEAIVDESVIIAGKLDEYPGLAIYLTTWIAFAADIRAAVANADTCILPALGQDFENFALSTTSFGRLLGELESACKLDTRNVRLFPEVPELLAALHSGPDWTTRTRAWSAFTKAHEHMPS